jgi:glycosyltransferase involved in cell wall biosynthesis
MPSTGLGRQARGFETFTEECSAALKNVHGLDITVFKGGGPRQNGHKLVANWPRDCALAKLASRWLGRSPYFVEQMTFFPGLLSHLISHEPDIIYYADINLGNLCWHWRRISGQRYRMLFYNGAGAPAAYIRSDVVQQVAPCYYNEASRFGLQSSRQELVPHGMTIEAAIPILSRLEQQSLRTKLALPIDRHVVVSVGMVDSQTKRMDYVISELALLPCPRPFLLILGQACSETPAVAALAHQKLGSENYAVRTVPRAMMREHYLASDTFTMASLREGFGLVYIEAMSCGLPCVVHDSDVTRYVCGASEVLVDLSATGALADALRRSIMNPNPEAERAARHWEVFERFSWEALRARYVRMFKRCAALKAPLA